MQDVKILMNAYNIRNKYQVKKEKKKNTKAKPQISHQMRIKIQNIYLFPILLNQEYKPDMLQGHPYSSGD